jgi:hypothetical protein
MRNLVLILLFSLASCAAQSASSAPVEPPSIGVVYFLASDQTLKPLPEEQWKAKGSGVFTATGSIEVSADRSSLRLASNDKTDFVFNIGTPEHVKIYRFTSDEKHKTRKFELVKIKGRTRETINGIPADITKFGGSSYRLVPRSPLAPGEYAVLTGSKIFSFGIDQ